MLGKLMKYEFKATARIFLPMFAALLAMAAVTRLTLGLRLETPHIISMVLSIMLMVSAFVLTLILTIQRFYKNFMTDEGYLTFTLPVSTGRLIWSKLIVAAIWTLVCTVAVFLALWIMAFSGNEWRIVIDGIRELGLPSRDVTLFLIEGCALILASLSAGILTIYASMALSMLSIKHRVSLSFAFYIALNTVTQILMSIFLWIFVKPNSMTAESIHTFFEQNTMGAIHVCALVSLAVTAAFGAAMFCTTRYMLKHRLNLQ
jgi:hypothetical protein